ncbi:MAG: diguanylate cyclase, partial [Planctomycetales bacterium]|nr:diguanylate cyclase [Planctomycetales bacterium]
METTSFENDATFERIQLHIEQLGKALDALDWSDEPSSGAQIGEHLQGLREAMESAALKLLETQEHSRALVVAQADALVRSAEIIDELEETKRQLAESRQLAEEAARDNQTLADTVLQGVNDPILLLKDGLCVACNRRVEEFFGVTADACLETCPIDILAPSESGTGESTPVERGARETIYERALREGLYQFETVLTRLGNVETWCEITMNRFPFKQEDHVLVVVRDISERKTFEEELLRNRDFLLNIINAVPDQIFVKSADRRIVLVNDAFCQAHDVLRDQVTGETADFLFAPEVAPEIDRVESRVIGAGQVETMEVECRPDGQEPRILSVKKSRYRDPVSDERMIVTTSRDVTDERAKSARMRLLASVFTNATEGVAILDPDGIVCEANPTFRRMLRRRNQSVEQSRLDELMEWRGQQFDGILGDVRAGRAWAGQMKFTPDQGGEHMFRVSFGPLPDEHGQVHKIIALFSDISELHKSRELLRKQVLHDSLTGLPNRRYFRDRVAEAVRRSSTQGKRFAIAFLDLDDFKDVNDTLGHNIGDELLRIVARRIRSTLRDDCFVARFGGDEFAVLIPDIDAGRQRVRNIAARISRVLQEPFRIGDAEAFVGVSIGTTVYPDHTSDPDELLRNADVAMYAAKSAGKNHARLFDYAMHNAVESRHRLQIALRNALDNGELTLFYQPKVTADTLEPRGCEALVRWFSENGRFVSPGEFIPIAEET